jgi:hypothetical protein
VSAIDDFAHDLRSICQSLILLHVSAAGYFYARRWRVLDLCVHSYRGVAALVILHQVVCVTVRLGCLLAACVAFAVMCCSMHARLVLCWCSAAQLIIYTYDQVSGAECAGAVGSSAPTCMVRVRVTVLSCLLAACVAFAVMLQHAFQAAFGLLSTFVRSAAMLQHACHAAFVLVVCCSVGVTHAWPGSFVLGTSGVCQGFLASAAHTCLHSN